ncbi:unnamed protein product [Phytophthora fragariaefolia]|uniref:Unnamed protein product n=1 Tax=Phytophthora fragariaefolia TaxID=1490495 RepID=A0A9W6TSK5_9STRA|nr:unnamed protein product [Phytophthora fragariaefolia]
MSSPRMTMVQRGNAVAAGSDIMAGPWVPEEPTKAPREVVVTGRGVLASVMSEVKVPRAATKVRIPKSLYRKRWLVSGGATRAAKRRQRRAEAELAIARKLLIVELHEQQTERANVLREEVRHVIAELRESQYLKQDRRRRREAQVAAEVVRREEQQRRERAAADTCSEEEPVDVATTAAVTAQPPARPIAAQTSTELLLLEQRYQQQLPDQLEKGSYAEMRAESRRGQKRPKKYRAARRRRRLQKRKELGARLEAVGMTTVRKQSRQVAGHKYQYEQQGCYGDTELRDNGGGKTL